MDTLAACACSDCQGPGEPTCCATVHGGCAAPKDWGCPKDFSYNEDLSLCVACSSGLTSSEDGTTCVTAEG